MTANPYDYMLDFSPDALLGKQARAGPKPQRRLSMSLDRAEIRQIAEEVAEATVERTMMALGVDSTSAQGVRDAQADFAYIRNQRLAGEAFKRNARKLGWSIVGMVVLGFVGWFLAALGLPAAQGGP